MRHSMPPALRATRHRSPSAHQGDDRAAASSSVFDHSPGSRAGTPSMERPRRRGIGGEAVPTRRSPNPHAAAPARPRRARRSAGPTTDVTQLYHRSASPDQRAVRCPSNTRPISAAARVIGRPTRWRVPNRGRRHALARASASEVERSALAPRDHVSRNEFRSFPSAAPSPESRRERRMSAANHRPERAHRTPLRRSAWRRTRRPSESAAGAHRSSAGTLRGPCRDASMASPDQRAVPRPQVRSLRPWLLWRPLGLGRAATARGRRRRAG